MLLPAAVRAADEMNPQLLFQLQPLIEIFSYTHCTFFRFHECQIAKFIAGAGNGAADEVFGLRR
ncbi:hypothetical protein D3C75_716690 [compost metagenome]